MINIFLSILPPFLIILIGYILGKVFPYDIKIVSRISLWLMGSILSFTFINDYPPTLSQLKLYGSGIILLFFIFYFISLFFKNDKTLVFINSVYINTGYLGYPILFSIWGESAISYGVIYSTINMLLASIFLPLMIGERINLKNIFKLPYIYVIVFAYILAKFNINYHSLPKPLLQTLLMLKESAIPLLLIFVGLSLSKIRFKESKITPVIFSSILRLLIYPLFSLLFVIITKMDKEAAKVFILESAMPTAINSVILVDTLTGNSSKISLTVAVTTIVSSLTIPIWTLLINYTLN